MTKIVNWYEVVGVPKGLSADDLEAWLIARRRLVQQLHHPDLHAAETQESRDWHAQQLREQLRGIDFLLSRQRDILDEYLAREAAKASAEARQKQRAESGSRGTTSSSDGDFEATGAEDVRPYPEADSAAAAEPSRPTHASQPTTSVASFYRLRVPLPIVLALVVALIGGGVGAAIGAAHPGNHLSSDPFFLPFVVLVVVTCPLAAILVTGTDQRLPVPFWTGVVVALFLLVITFMLGVLISHGGSFPSTASG